MERLIEKSFGELNGSMVDGLSLLYQYCDGFLGSVADFIDKSEVFCFLRGDLFGEENEPLIMAWVCACHNLGTLFETQEHFFR